LGTHHLPSDPEIRERIERIGETIHISDIKKIPGNPNDEQYRLAFMYQLLIAGRVSEVCGQYAPRGTDVFEVDFDGVPAIMFAVKTAKREGQLRACAIPLDPIYEPWSKPLLDYFRRFGDEKPFLFHKRWSVRLLQYATNEVFKGLEWTFPKYTKSVECPIEDFEILATRIDDKGREKNLIELNEDTAKWCTRMGENLLVPYEVGRRWKPFTSHALRKRRTRTLTYFYKFDGFMRSAYCGWKETSHVNTLPDSMDVYTYLDINALNRDEAIEVLKSMTSIYFANLLKPMKAN